VAVNFTTLTLRDAIEQELVTSLATDFDMLEDGADSLTIRVNGVCILQTPFFFKILLLFLEGIFQRYITGGSTDDCIPFTIVA